MRSVIVCEGRDDLWFISYYLHRLLSGMNVMLLYGASHITFQQNPVKKFFI